MKTLSDITGGARANKTSTLPLRYWRFLRGFPHKSRLTLRSGTALNGAGSSVYYRAVGLWRRWRTACDYRHGWALTP